MSSGMNKKFIALGVELLRTLILVKNRLAATASRLAVRRSRVLPC